MAATVLVAGVEFEEVAAGGGYVGAVAVGSFAGVAVTVLYGADGFAGGAGTAVFGSGFLTLVRAAASSYYC